MAEYKLRMKSGRSGRTNLAHRLPRAPLLRGHHACHLRQDCLQTSIEAMTRLQCTDPTPSCIVVKRGGFHAYWWLDQPVVDLQTARRLA